MFTGAPTLLSAYFNLAAIISFCLSFCNWKSPSWNPLNKKGLGSSILSWRSLYLSSMFVIAWLKSNLVSTTVSKEGVTTASTASGSTIILSGSTSDLTLE